MSMVERNCAACGRAFEAREADVKRGWAKCCSKSCAANRREKKMNRGRVWEGSEDTDIHGCDHPHPYSEDALCQW